MKSKFAITTTIWIVLLSTSFFSCDDHNSDALNLRTVELDLITIPNGPAILNPLSVLEANLQRAQFVSEPASGLAELINQSSLIRYSPDDSFMEGSDLFTVDLTDQEGQRVATKVNIRMMDSNSPSQCSSAFGGVFDYIRMRPGESIQINLLENDVFCGGPGISSSSATSMIVLTADEVIAVSGEPNIQIGPGAFAQLTYTAPEDFTGTIDFIYELGMNGPNSNQGPRIVGNMLNPQAFDTYVIAQATIEVVSEN